MKRTEPKAVGELLDQILKSPNIVAKIAEGGLPDTWRRVVGPIVAEQTRQVRFLSGTLYVHVTSAVMRSELMMQREALVKAINRQAGINIVHTVVVQ